MIKIALYNFLTIFFFFTPLLLQAQPTLQWNALLDVEMSKGGAQSHFYYNEIDENNKDARIGLSQLNLVGKLVITPNWQLNGRFLLERDRGQKLDRLVVPQLNLQWLASKRKFGFTIGSFTNPFGSFNSQQLSIDRNFVGLPLAYSYYVNISDKIGFVENLGDITEINIDEERQWGGTNLYYGGYSTGALFSWTIKPSKINWKLAVVTGATNLQKRFTDPLHLGIISRLKLQATYFWEQGFSFSHGSFLRDSEVSSTIDQLKKYRQTLLGTDFKLGVGFVEFSGEIIAAFYKTPVFLPDENRLLDTPAHLSNVSAYLDTKYELPFLQGSYLAYRIDRMTFGASEGYATNGAWDNAIWRHTLAAGYRFNEYFLARFAFSTQRVANKDWDKTQRTLRLVLTAHY